MTDYESIRLSVPLLLRLPFLRAVRDSVEPDTVVCMGDESDWHSLSHHEHDPDLPAPGDELC